MKKCFYCNKIKILSEFHKNKKMKDGLQGQCKECRILYAVKVKNKVTSYKKLYRLQNKERIKKEQRAFYIKNLAKRLVNSKVHRLNNKEKYKRYKKEYEKTRRKIDVVYKLISILRTRIYSILKNKTKSGSAVRDLGCSIPELKQHLESKFQPGMTWENHGLYGWHIDHIRPLSSFNLNLREEFLKACNYTNLQPMWARDNLKKGKKYVF